VSVAERLLRVWSLASLAGMATVVVLWLVGAVIPYLANAEDAGITGAWDWISSTGGSLMFNGLVFGSMAWGLANVVRDRLAIARRVVALFAAVNVVLLALALSGVGSDGSKLLWAAGSLFTVAALVTTLLPGSSQDFSSMVAVRAEHDQTVRRVLNDVGLDPDTAMARRPHEFSGGQCQRICIARALVLDPKVIICDEPVSALDVSVQAQILNLLQDMKARYDLTLVFIAHDLAVVKNVSDRVAVMYLGKVCEVADPDDLYARPAHPYTSALLASIPVPDPSIRQDEMTALTGELPSPVDPPSGCRFRTRCPQAQDLCAAEEPVIRSVGDGHYVACHFPLVTSA
jgi:oligopeptide/dipeptide ABC transporter ATP-binding protein